MKQKIPEEGGDLMHKSRVTQLGMWFYTLVRHMLGRELLSTLLQEINES